MEVVSKRPPPAPIAPPLKIRAGTVPSLGSVNYDRTVIRTSFLQQRLKRIKTLEKMLADKLIRVPKDKLLVYIGKCPECAYKYVDCHPLPELRCPTCNIPLVVKDSRP